MSVGDNSPHQSRSGSQSKPRRIKRQFLLLIGAVVGGGWLAGCARLITESTDGGTSENESEGRSENETEGVDSSTNEETTHTDTDTPTTETKTKPENQSQNDTENTTTHDTQEERQRAPTEEQTEVNRSKYNETSVRETTERPQSDVKIAGVSPFTMPDGVVVVSPTITNVSNKAIDFVDLDIYYLDADDNEIGHSTDIVRELDAGETDEFSGSILERDLDLRGSRDVEDARVEPSPQDYVDG